jgi:hypothetical protein
MQLPNTVRQLRGQMSFGSQSDRVIRNILAGQLRSKVNQYCNYYSFLRSDGSGQYAEDEDSDFLENFD